MVLTMYCDTSVSTSDIVEYCSSHNMLKEGVLPSIKAFEKWLTTGNAASRLCKSRQGVVWMLENKRLRGARTPLGWLVDPNDVERFEKEQGKEQHE